MMDRSELSEHLIVIFTAIPVEFAAVIQHLQGLQEVKHPSGTIYEKGYFISEKKAWQVAVVETGAGNERAALEAERAINFFNPSFVLFVGVAGGLKDVRLGDVIAVTKCYGYHYGKAEKDFKPRSEFGVSSYQLTQHAKSVSRRTNWLMRINRDEGTSSSPRSFIGPIAAGQAIVASTISPTYKLLRQNFSDALAVEMESLGFYTAVFANEPVKALVIRGISDLIDKKEEADAGGSQEIASQNASAFAFEVLATLENAKSDEAIKKDSIRVDQGQDEWWKQFAKLAADLYPGGPSDSNIWQRSGGNLSSLTLGSTGFADWFAALRKLRLGGGGQLTIADLIDTMIEDYPTNPNLTLMSQQARATERN